MNDPEAGQRHCPECGERLQPITILDEVERGKHIGLTYTAGDARRSLWTGRYPVSGPVRALMCAGCGRILLYGAMPSALTPSEGPAGRGDEPAPSA